jgi:two-component system sensor histidine kinase/response regulator
MGSCPAPLHERSPATTTAMDVPPPAAPPPPPPPDGGAPASVDALQRECAALRAEITQLRAHLATAQQAVRTPSVAAPVDDALRATLRELQAAFETAGVGMVVMHYRTMRRCNRAMERMFGYAPGALDQQPVELLHGDDARWTEVGEAIRAAMRRGEVYQDECELLRRDGTRFWVRRAGCALAANDPIEGTVWVYEDITAQRQAAHDMQQAKEMAEQATRMKSEFLANMRHEIRTPMNNILGLTQLALRGGLPAQQHEQVRSIRASAQHLFGMLGDILDLSAIEAGKLKLRPQAFSPRALLQDVAMQARNEATAKGLALRIEPAHDLVQGMIGDVEQLRRILLLLVRNAIKFTLRGEVCIVATTTSVDARSAVLRLQVHDTGIGLGADEKAQLFERFAQVDNSSTRRHGGTGLGLSLCKALVRLMGGSVGVESELGQGSVFWIALRLPLTEAATAAAAAPPRPHGAADRPAQAGTPHPDATAHLDRLDALLADSDPEALDWLAHHTSGLAPLLGSEFPAFATRVRTFDFDAAREQLRTLRSADGSSPQPTASR